MATIVEWRPGVWVESPIGSMPRPGVWLLASVCDASTIRLRYAHFLPPISFGTSGRAKVLKQLSEKAEEKTNLFITGTVNGPTKSPDLNQ